jgi:ADP-dependent NAD(P)H-hydrate dehydratase / NAD(P)H-hydrate epimerase
MPAMVTLWRAWLVRPGLEVAVYQLGEAADLSGAAAEARDWAAALGVAMPQPGPPQALAADVVVDALLGTGISGPCARLMPGRWISSMASGVPVLAIDLPTGVNADTGAADRPTVQAGCLGVLHRPQAGRVHRPRGHRAVAR